MKIYKKGNYIYLINASGDIKQDHANEVKITKTNVANETYSIYSDDLGVNNVTFAELTQENGTAYASVQAWELWYAENTGFNPASGGSGAGTVINTVSNFANLPDPTLVSNDFYWVSSATGYRIIGTYKSNGLYYSNGTTWEYIDAPTTATQSEVNTGTLTDKYLTPSTFENATKWTTKVPYTGATSDVNLGEFGIQLGNLEFDNTPTNMPTTVGSMVWNDSDGTLDLKLKGGNVTLQVGQEQVLRVVNKTSTNVNLLEANYQAVRVTGAQGQRLKVDLAKATNDVLSAETIGLVTETINNNQEGFITTSGLVRGVNTTGSLQGETWADGDVVYLSPTTAGNITNIKPTAPNHLIIIGYVVYAHINQGTIFVKVDNGYELNELHNVKIDNGTLANNDIIAYNSTTLVWENKPNAPVTTTSSLTDSTDKRFVTDTEKTKLTNTTNTNSGDETNGTIKTKLGVASGSNDGYLSSSDYTTFASAGSPFIPNLTASAIAGGYYGNNGSATFSILGNVSAAALSGTASAVTQTNTSVITRTIRIQIPTGSTAGSRAGIRTASLRHAVGQGFSFSVGWCIQDAAYVVGSKQFHGLLPISTLGTLNNLVDNSSLINFIGVGSDALDTNLQVFYNDATGTASKIDLGVNFPANRTLGAVLDKFYVFDMYNEHDSMNVKYRITDRVSGNTAQGTISTDLPDATVLLGAQSLRTNGVTALAQVTQWSHLIGYYL